MKKWAPIIESMGVTGSKSDWMSEYAKSHIDKESQRNTKINDILSESSQDFPTLLPMAMQVASKTIGLDIVAVKPLANPGMTQEDLDRIEAEIKQKNRDSKIDSLIEGTEYKEEKVEDHPDYKNGPLGNLLYMDFKYGHKKTRRAGKKHKK